jgi:glycosyltransferase involved in cell wall biosynthesis
MELEALGGKRTDGPSGPDGMRDATELHTLADPRPGVAVIANSVAPYRVHLQRRIARELSDIRLWTLFTHEQSNSPWPFDPPHDIGPVSFGKGQSSQGQGAPRHALREWRKGGRIIDWLRENRISAVVMLGYNDPGRLRIIRWCNRHGVPCFLSGDSNVKGDRASGLSAWLKRAIVGRIVRSCWGAMPFGTLGRAYFEKYGAQPDRIFLFPCEPDYELIERLRDDEIDGVRKRFGLSPSRRRMVFSGRLTQVKRPELLIDAFAAIAGERPAWDLLVIGGGPLAEDLIARLPERARSRVTFTGFLDDPATIAALYRTSDVLVLPSDYEPWGLVVNEAAAAGLAIVCSDVVGAAAELVREGVNGRLFPRGDGAALAQCLRDVTSEGRIDAMKSRSRRLLEDWRRRGDPVDGLRRALAACGVLPTAAVPEPRVACS